MARRASAATKMTTACTVRGCTKDHRNDDPILDGVFNTPLLDLAQNYISTLVELEQSMLDDKNADRRIAFFSRIRDVNECYYRALWSCLIATKEEIVHDASNENPRQTLSALEKIVCEQIFNQSPVLAKRLDHRRNSSPLNILNTATHMNANFVIYHGGLNEDSVSRTYVMILGNLQNEIRVLRYVKDSLTSGVERPTILAGVRVIRNGRMNVKF
jgi:hypothetical protein